MQQSGLDVDATKWHQPMLQNQDIFSFTIPSRYNRKQSTKLWALSLILDSGKTFYLLYGVKHG